MKKIIKFSLFFVVVFIHAQYTKYLIKGVGSVLVSEELELKDGDYKELTDRLTNKAGIQIDRDRVVFQQRELNTFDDGFNTYCRFIIETEYGNYDTMSSKK